MTKPIRLIATLLAVLAGAFGSGAAVATAGTGSHTVVYRGVHLAVPAGWPVVRLATDPTACVRFDRHAIYLGNPSAAQRCPATAIGRTEAILVRPDGRVTVTWNRDRGLVQRILGRRVRDASAASARSARDARPALATTQARTAAAGGVYTGLGFDACSAPSLQTLAAWGASSYRALGAYIGGANRACAQPNLSAAWVYAASQAGWHLIPTYVGLQAPANTCGCAAITPAQAAVQGAAAAQDAITQMQALGLGAGNPIYDDMEYYSRTSTNTSAVLAFLQAWTTTLHAAHYLSGVYGNGDSVMADLVAQEGSSYIEPDDIWVADWNRTQSTADPSVPSGDWASHQRLHQYSGGHDETYGGVTINIDSDYLDGPTASGGIAPATALATAPSLRIQARGDGSIVLTPRWAGVAGISSWELFGGYAPSTLTRIGATATALTTHSSLAYYAVQAFDAGGRLLGSSQPVTLPAHIVIYGHGAYTPQRGLGSVPVGCFTGAACRIRLRFTSGRTVLAATAPEPVRSGGDGLVYFQLTPAGRRRLAAARGARLPVTVTAIDSSGARAQATLSLIRFTTAGRGPRRDTAGSSTIRVVGGTDFVGAGGFGGILAGCSGPAACSVTTTVAVQGRVVARTGPEMIGANELGYLFFQLTPAARKLLAAAKGNQLGAHVAVASQVSLGAAYGPPIVAGATADLALVSV